LTLRRLAAGAALLAPVLAALVIIVGLWGDVARLVVAVAVLFAVVAAAWYAVTRRGVRRVIGIVLVGALLAAEVVAILGAERRGVLLVVAGALLGVGITAAGAVGLTSPRSATTAATDRAQRVAPAAQGALIVNLKSGGGKAERFHLDVEAARRGIEVVVLQPGDDLRQLAVDAVDRGADVIGMAGGDGSQALVASVAAERGVALVCVPAGTRNHFALDLGLDRDDVVGALDAFGDAVERRIDLAAVNGRTFVNNVSLGVYAEIVQSEEYRNAKRRTTAAMLPELLGPDAAPFDLHFEGPDGKAVDGAQLVLVSNNPYELTSFTGGFGTRTRLDTGALGVAAVHLVRDRDVTKFAALEAAGRLGSFSGWQEWSAPRFEVRSSAPVAAGVDGEALLIEPPLVFESRPGALRVRIPLHASGRSPADLRTERSLVGTAKGLVDVLAGRARA
jgi:diacylglycerol kinase family enzyme